MKKLAIALISFAAILPMVGCDNQGPAEKAGERIDEAVDDASDAVEDAGDEVEDAMDGH